MKKYSILLIMFISLFFVFNKNVFAIGSCTCVYGTDALGFKIEVSDSGTPKVSIIGTASTVGVLGTTNFAPVNFQDTSTKKWKCPETIYYEVYGSGRSVHYSNLSVKKPENGTISQSALVPGKSSDGEPYEENNGGEAGNSLYCVYGNLMLTIDNSNKVVNGSNAGCTDIGIPSYDALEDKTKCPDYIYGIKVSVPRTNGYTCRYSWTRSDGLTKIERNGDEPVVDADGNVVNSTTTTRITSNEADDEYYTGCPLGKHVTKDIYGLLKILKIVVPILVIGLTILEGVKAVAKGEIAGEEKKLATRFVKRLIIAVILFFLPVLVNQIMIMANIWDENGTCDFSKTSSLKDNTTTKSNNNRQEQVAYCTSACSTSSEYNKCYNTCTNCVSGCQKAYANDSDKYKSCLSTCSK